MMNDKAIISTGVANIFLDMLRKGEVIEFSSRVMLKANKDTIQVFSSHEPNNVKSTVPLTIEGLMTALSVKQYLDKKK